MICNLLALKIYLLTYILICIHISIISKKSWRTRRYASFANFVWPLGNLEGSAATSQPALYSNVDTFIVKSAIEHLVKTGPQVCISRVWRWFMAACPSNNKKRQNWPARHSALLSWAAQLCPIYLVAGWPAELSSFKERPHVASRAVR